MEEWMILWTFVEWKYIKYYKRSGYVKESMVIICQIGNEHKIIKECVCWEGESCLLSPCRLGCWGLWRILVFLYTSNTYSIISTSKVSFFLTQLRKCFSFFFLNTYSLFTPSKSHFSLLVWNIYMHKEYKFFVLHCPLIFFFAFSW